MSNTSLDVLKTNLESLSSSIRWLRRSYDICMGIGKKDNYTEDEFDHFENLTSRYARTVDFLIGKVLRSIDQVELMNSGSIIDAANGAEKRGIVESVSKLRDLKDLRNEIAHEYETEDIKALFSLILVSVPQLFKIAEKTMEYCTKYQKDKTDKIRYIKVDVPCYDDIPGNFPLRIDDRWIATIDIVTGIIRDWKQGISGRVFSKACDGGKYYLLNENKEIVFKQEYGYVPNKLLPPKDGFDDYIDLEINEEGKIINWYENPSFEDFRGLHSGEWKAENTSR
jgi:hypothetical protein